MKVTRIQIEYGATQNIGDYSNVKPSIVIAADLEDGDDPKKVLASLKDQAVTAIHALVDDELEQIGNPPRYYDGKLFHIERSDIRKCVVLAPQKMSRPQERNWKEGDHWYSLYRDDGPCLHNLRLETALAIWKTYKAPEGYVKVDCRDGDLSILPPLPDVGPEPAWHSKDLANYLRGWSIDEERWAELGELDYLDRDYCVRLNDVRYTNRSKWVECVQEDVAAFILANRNLDQVFPPDPDPVPVIDEDYDDDDDYGDDDDYDDDRG